MMFQSLMIFFSLLVISGSLPSPQIDTEDVVGEPQVAVTDCECVLITLMDQNSGKVSGDVLDYLLCELNALFTGKNIGNCLTPFKSEFWCYVTSTRYL